MRTISEKDLAKLKREGVRVTDKAGNEVKWLGFGPVEKPKEAAGSNGSDPVANAVQRIGEVANRLAAGEKDGQRLFDAVIQCMTQMVSVLDVQVQIEKVREQVESQAPPSWVFDIRRNRQGFIEQIIANPVRTIT
jgi:hypothetical protein